MPEWWNGKQALQAVFHQHCEANAQHQCQQHPSELGRHCWATDSHNQRTGSKWRGPGPAEGRLLGHPWTLGIESIDHWVGIGMHQDEWEAIAQHFHLGWKEGQHLHWTRAIPPCRCRNATCNGKLQRRPSTRMRVVIYGFEAVLGRTSSQLSTYTSSRGEMARDPPRELSAAWSKVPSTRRSTNASLAVILAHAFSIGCAFKQVNLLLLCV